MLSIVTDLGTRFKSYSVRLVLAVVLKELEGTVLFKIKRPPSNRLWFSFTTMPRLVLCVEPVVSTRQIKWSLITKPIESRRRGIVMESIVMPHMDDLAFLNTKAYTHRGGIFADCARKAADLVNDAGTVGDVGTTSGHADEAGLGDEDEHDGLSIAPGIPSLKLGDDRSSIGSADPASAASNLRQRLPNKSKHSDSEASVKSTQSAPLLEDPRKEKDIHTRKKSWFGGTSSTSTSPTSTPKASRSSVGESDSSLPLPSNSSKGPPLSGSLDMAKQPVSRKTTHPVAENLVGDGTDGAADRLRDILESGKKSRLGSGSSPDENIRATLGPEVPVVTPERPISAPLLKNTPIQSTNSLPRASSTVSTASDFTSQAAAPSLIFDTVSGQSGLESSKPPSLLREQSDKFVSSIQTALSQDSVNAVPNPSPFGMPLSPSPTPAAGSSTILNNWRVKAADKQALQASVDRGVSQAKDAMNKWSNKWQAYRKQQAGERQDEHDEPTGTAVDPAADAFTSATYPASASAAATLDTKTPELVPVPTMSKSSSHSNLDSGSRMDENPDGRSRANSIASTSPRHFKPSAPMTTTSLTMGDAVSVNAPSASSSPNLSSSQSNGSTKRVPPPSTVPVHPAFSNHTQNRRPAAASKQPVKSDKSGYKPAAMMAIPGIHDSRRVAVSSEDFRSNGEIDSKPPALPFRTGDSSSLEQSVATPESPIAPFPIPEGTALSQPVPAPTNLTSSAPAESESSEIQQAPPFPTRPAKNVDLNIDVAIPSLSVEPATPSEVSI